MRRRDLVALMVGAAIGAPRRGRAQQRGMPVIGYLNATKPIPALLDEFRNGLAENGYREGQNVVIEYRWAEGQYDRLPGLAAELVRRRVDVIVATGGTPPGQAARAATNTIPIVILSGADPVAAGLVGSLSHPGGNVTGVSQLVSESDAKRLELLHELVPAAGTIAYLENPTFPGAREPEENIVAEARTLGVKLSVIKATTDRDFGAAFATISQARTGALLIGPDPFFFAQQDQLVALSARNSVPTMYFFREFVTAGGLISYGTRLGEGYRQVGVYAGRILRGAKPADLPIAQQSEKIELVINLKTAKALGLAIPPSILARADEVIE
jgi:putative tryptophan/tyrosine transport system substrate-binding protein